MSLESQKQETNILNHLNIGAFMDVSGEPQGGAGGGGEGVGDGDPPAGTPAGNQNPPQGGNQDPPQDPPQGNEGDGDDPPQGNEGEGNNDDGNESSDFFISNDGDIVDKDGNVLIKAGEFETDENGAIVVDDKVAKALGLEGEGGENEDSIIAGTVSSLTDLYGLEFKDEQGNPITFSDDEKGVAALVQNAASQLRDRAINTFFSENTEMFKLYKHLQSGGTTKSYLTGNHYQDYRNLPDPTTDSEKKNLIKESFVVANGMSETMAQQMVDLIADAGELDSNVVTAKDNLGKYQDNYEAQVENDLRIKEEAEQKQRVAHWTKVKGIVDSGNLGNLRIPTNERKSFFDYMSKPANQEGYSQASIDAAKDNLDHTVLINYLRFKGFDLTKVFGASVKQAQANSFKTRRANMKLRMQNKNLVGKGDPTDLNEFPTPAQLSRNSRKK